MRAMADTAELEALTRAIPRVSWFAATATPLTDADRADGVAYAAALGFGAIRIAPVTSWPEARRIAMSPNAAPWWDTEDRLVKALAPDPALIPALTRVTDAASAVVHGAASIVLTRAGIADGYLARAAAGAATQGCYHAALALAAQAGDQHPFAIKFRLYEAGRWPLGILGGALHIL